MVRTSNVQCLGPNPSLNADVPRAGGCARRSGPPVSSIPLGCSRMDIGSWIGFFVIGWGATFSAYVVLQVIALLTLKRPIWYAAALPVPIMLWVAYVTFDAFLHSSNMWPMLMIMASPFAVVFVLVIAAIGLIIQAHARRWRIVSAMLAVAVAAAGSYVYMSTAAA